jgi:hypothetical protein
MEKLGGWGLGAGIRFQTNPQAPAPRPWRFLLIVAVVVALLAGGSAADGKDAPRTARELLDHVRRLNETTRAWRDRTQRLDLTIVDRRKNERRREMKIVSKKFGAGEMRTILFFLSPVDVRGVGLLQWSSPHQPDTQWLHLPDLGQPPRRISGTSKRESFVGTDFSFEDLTIWSDILDWDEQDAHASLLSGEALQGQDCAVIEMVPTGAEVSYEKIRLWLGGDDWVIHRMEFEDGGKTVKTLELNDVRPVGKIPVAHRLEMHNLRGGSSTVVVFTTVDFDTGVTDDEFTQRRLERGI